MNRRVLVFGLTENPGGVESFLYNYYSHIDRDIIQFDFLCNTHDKVAYEDELKAMGARFFHITARKKNSGKFKAELTQLFDDHAKEWGGIWVNVCSLANIDYLKIAKKHGIPKRIIHSHNSENMDGFFRGMLHKWNKNSIVKYATDFWACSEDAKKWFYKKSIIGKAMIIPNAIDINELKFDEEKRNSIRKKIGATEKDYVIGNIGRLHFQKNQSFIIDVFCEYFKQNERSKLVFVGEGEDRDKLEKKCKGLKIADSVSFVGIQRNIADWLSAFDLFLFPSLFEGMSVVALEAQANGVPILASEGVLSSDLYINDNIILLNLDDPIDKWVNTIDAIKEHYGRNDVEMTVQCFKEKGYLINDAAQKLQKLLLV